LPLTRQNISRSQNVKVYWLVADYLPKILIFEA
jgi:hypothetical protein